MDALPPHAAPLIAPPQLERSVPVHHTTASLLDTFGLTIAPREPITSPPVPGMLGDRDWDGYLDHIESLRTRGVDVQRLGEVDGKPVDVVRIPAQVQPAKLKVLVTGGVHGNESSGPAGALALIEHLLAHPELSKHVEVTIIPMVCPPGYVNATRHNLEDQNVNREMKEGDDVPVEVALAREVMKAQSYDLSIDLHRSRSGGGKGFFVLQRQADSVLSTAMERFRGRYPVLSRSTKLYEMFAPGVFKSKNTGTVKDYMAELGTLWSYTVEAPSKGPYAQQVLGSRDICLELIKAALQVKAAPRSRILL